MCVRICVCTFYLVSVMVSPSCVFAFMQRTSWTSWNKGLHRQRGCSIPSSPSWTRWPTGEWPSQSGFSRCSPHSSPVYRTAWSWSPVCRVLICPFHTCIRHCAVLFRSFYVWKAFPQTLITWLVIKRPLWQTQTLWESSLLFCSSSVKSVAQEQKNEIMSQLQTIRYLMKKRGMDCPPLHATSGLFVFNRAA